MGGNKPNPEKWIQLVIIVQVTPLLLIFRFIFHLVVFRIMAMCHRKDYIQCSVILKASWNFILKSFVSLSWGSHV